ncbi:unnamed protein product [Medioppia subpectinata]|uniref:Protein kinase domain-containing protein n=1 Tax=Medioppia subpectinata TaxID=1979941 RepID=A0A7R9KMI4_9ACAR|nr:unnamed protein product [Medioppia subpectinata]CAG2105027.1 unnamed protein product [Medioppia subpectinata]
MRLDDKIYAVKRVQFKDKENRVLKEVKSLSKLDSNFVVKYYNSWTEGKHLYIQMEYCPQTLADVLKDKERAFGRQSPDESMTVFEYFMSCELFRELLQCLEYLHNQNPKVIHRDLKPSNILISRTITNNTFIKLGDFGLATEHHRPSNSHTRGAGTPDYMAPEVHLYNTYDCRADVYSLSLPNGPPVIKYWKRLASGQSIMT